MKRLHRASFTQALAREPQAVEPSPDPVPVSTATLPREPSSPATILVSTDIARWLIEQGERVAFNEPAPHYCKLCDAPVATRDQKAHLRGHVRQIEQQAKARKRDATERLRQVTRLRREGARA